jgi:predicted nucleic acid-binding protein
VLVDTSVWIDHFRKPNTMLVARLKADTVWTHPFVIGELACGNLSARKQILSLLGELHTVPLQEHDKVLKFIEVRRLHGQGLGWVDMHLLASAYAAQMPLWTLDKRLDAAAMSLDLSPGQD